LRVLFVQAAWVVLIKPQSWERHESLTQLLAIQAPKREPRIMRYELSDIADNLPLPASWINARFHATLVEVVGARLS
jgi:hypothetical protein